MSIFKAVTIILLLLFPIGWAWLTLRVFQVPLPAWLILLLSYLAIFELERSVTFTLEHGKNSQVLAGATFPFLAGLLLIAMRGNVGAVLSIGALVGAILLHYSILYMVATFFAAYFLVYPPRGRKDWMALLRLGFAGISALAIFMLVFKPALSDPRAGSFGWPDLADGPRRMAAASSG